MQPLIKRLNNLNEQVLSAFAKLSIDSKTIELEKINQQLAQAEIWNNPDFAQELYKQQNRLSRLIDPWMLLKTQVADLIELLSISDQSMLGEFDGQIKALEKDYKKLSRQLLFNGVYDGHDVIMRITSGVGGSDAQDWAEMLERMYLRWAEKNNISATIIDRSPGEEAGVKTSVIEINMPLAYGILRSENGVHRLVRLSPFNSDNLRQTSFALVEILPKIDKNDDIKIDDKDLRIDLFRSSGKGGQSVNTTDSAVRITHLPSGIVVSVQNERSQLQNKETALKILRSKLVQLSLEQDDNDLSKLRAGESASWGSQIRNYVMHPYTLVKDTRTKYQEKNVQAVLDGEINGFIENFQSLSK